MDDRISRKWIINRETVEVEFQPGARLLDVLRERLGLTGTKAGCEEGECGACTVLIEGVLKLACLTLAATLPEGCRVTTVEGIEKEAEGRRLQQAFLDEGAVQCGFCTPGMLVAAYWVLRNPHLSVPEGLSGNLCRCTGYRNIMDAVEACRAPGEASS